MKFMSVLMTFIFFIVVCMAAVSEPAEENGDGSVTIGSDEKKTAKRGIYGFDYALGYGDYGHGHYGYDPYLGSYAIHHTPFYGNQHGFYPYFGYYHGFH